jgi:hemolysin D
LPDRLIRTFQSETGEIEASIAPARTRLSVLLLAAMFGLLLLVAAVFKVERVVTSLFGEIVTVEPTEVLQPFDLSIIKTIDVYEGERVKKGQLLATLDQTIAASSVDALRLQIASLDPEIARCEAELAGRPFVYIAGGGPGEAQYAALQHAYYLQRKAAYDAQVKSYQAQIAQYQATIRELTNDEARYGDRTKLAKDLQDMRANLAKSPAFSRLELLQATDQTTEVRREMEADENNIPVTQQQVQSTQELLDNYVQQWRAQTSQELVTARNQRDAAQQQLQAALKHLDVVQLYAPDDAVVLRLAKLSVGSVLQPGTDFIELASLRSPVEAEVYIDPKDVGFIRAGDRVMIKLDPYRFVEHGWAEGRLRWVSQGTFTVPPTGIAGPVNAIGTSLGAAPNDTGDESTPSQLTTPFYKARIAITRLDLRNVPPDLQLLPGTTLEADIHVGKRSLFWYLFGGLVRGFDEAMREP